MFTEIVNPSHPDKVADRIAGAIVDYCYEKEENPKVAVEVLIGHGGCTVIIETNVTVLYREVKDIIRRISGDDNIKITLTVVPQDTHLAENQDGEIRCGDNGIFKGCVTSREEVILSTTVKEMYEEYPYDGKYVLYIGDSPEKDLMIVCQSKAGSDGIYSTLYDECKVDMDVDNIIVNPLGYWDGGVNVDSGATNRKLGSDMGLAVTGGGLHGKDLSKADVSINIFAHLLAEYLGENVYTFCAIGDTSVVFQVDVLYGMMDRVRVPYAEIVKVARAYIYSVGGFEKFAEWGLHSDSLFDDEDYLDTIMGHIVNLYSV